MTVYCAGQEPINVPADLDASIRWPRWVDEAEETPGIVWTILKGRQDAKNARWDAEQKRKAQEVRDAALARLKAILDAEDADPCEWPAWTDEYRWELDEPPGDDAPFDPSPEDERDLPNLFPITAAEMADRQDWDEYAAWADRVDALATLSGIEPEHMTRIGRIVAVKPYLPGCCHELADLA